MDPNQFIQTSEACQALLAHVKTNPAWAKATMEAVAIPPVHANMPGTHDVIYRQHGDVHLMFKLGLAEIGAAYATNELSQIAAKKMAEAEAHATEAAVEGSEPDPGLPEDLETSGVDATDLFIDATGKRRDSGLTRQEHLDRFGSSDEIPIEHPDHLQNRMAYLSGWKAANQEEPDVPPHYINAVTTSCWRSGYNDRIESPEDVPTAESLFGKNTPHRAKPEPNKEGPIDPAVIRAAISSIIESVNDRPEYALTKQYLHEARNVCPQPRA